MFLSLSPCSEQGALPWCLSCIYEQACEAKSFQTAYSRRQLWRSNTVSVFLSSAAAPVLRRGAEGMRAHLHDSEPSGSGVHCVEAY